LPVVVVPEPVPGVLPLPSVLGWLEETLVSAEPVPVAELRLELPDEPWLEDEPDEEPLEVPVEDPWPDVPVEEPWGQALPEFGAWYGTGRVRAGLMPDPGSGRVRPAVAGLLVVGTPVLPWLPRSLGVPG
jgi:hypothetical protein